MTHLAYPLPLYRCDPILLHSSESVSSQSSWGTMTKVGFRIWRRRNDCAAPSLGADAAAAQQERTLYPPPTQAGCWWESPPRLPSRFGRITSAAPPPTARRLGGYARLQNGPVSAAEQLALPGTTVGILQRRICDVPRTAAKDEGEPRTATAALPRTGYGNLRPPTGAVPASPRLQTGASY